MNPAPETPEPFPAYIPPHFIRDFDLWAELTAQGESAYQWAATLHQTTPPIFWIPRLGFLAGTWVPRRAEDLRRILQDPQTFSSVGLTPYAMLLGESWPLAPLEIDPPAHAKYRALLNPSRSLPRKRNADFNDCTRICGLKGPLFFCLVLSLQFFHAWNFVILAINKLNIKLKYVYIYREASYLNSSQSPDNR